MGAEIRLYDYQAESIEQLRANIRAGKMTQVLSAPTGSGKTICATYLVDECYKKGKRALFVADRIPLIDQTSAVFDQHGIPHGVIQGQHWRNRPWERVQVASAQTLARRRWPPADLIIVDEAHTIHRNVVARIAKRDVVTIGLTATPFTRGLGKYYDDVVSVTTTNKLIADGFLAPYRIFSASAPDMKGAKTVAGEWTDAEAEKRSMPIIGDCVTEYLKHCAGQKFICFGVNTRHCEALQRQFMAAGVQCALYTYKTSDTERAEMVREFRDPGGYLTGLISVAALSKGFDVPTVECIIMARPLRTSLAEHIQIFGRGLRIDPANPSKVCTILDHAGNCERLWDPTMAFFENGAHELDDGKPKPKAQKKPREREPMKCPKCAHVHAPRPMCPACGHQYPRRSSSVEHKAGSLRELAGGEVTGEDRRKVWAMLLHIANSRGYATGWAAHKYRERFGAFPRGIHPAPEPPTPELENWVRSRAIAYARAKKKQRAS